MKLNMEKTVLQIPMSKTLRTRAEKTALSLGFSSLQEIMRVFMSKLASRTIEVNFQEAIHLSPKAEKRYEKMLQEFEKGKNVYYAKDTSDLLDQLNGDIPPRKVSKKLS